MSELVEVSGAVYDALAGTAITVWVREMANQEWEPDDFVKWGQDLLAPAWSVQVVPVAAIKMRQELLASAEFQAELRDRIATQINLIRAGTPIPPLVLRGGDLFLFDGYARAHALTALGISECLAYVSQR